MMIRTRKILAVLLFGLAAIIFVLLLMSLEAQAAGIPIGGVSSGDVATGEPRPLSASTTCTVTSTTDSGPGTLRQCLSDAETGYTITFDQAFFPLPPSGPATITITSGPLPYIDKGNITVDGSGAGVIIDGSQLITDWYDGLRITSNSNTIRELTIQNFPSDGVEIRDGAGNKIEHCIISGNHNRGVIVTGTNAVGNTLTQNNITDNDGSGIENSNGGNQELAWPIIAQIITSTSGITVSGFAQPGATVEVFADPTTEGQIFLGDDKVDSTRRFTVFSSTTSIEGMNITATATDDASNTSEFAQTLIWPLSRSTTPDGPFSSPFGPRLKASEGFRYDFHRGLDISTTISTPIYAVADGQVCITGTHPAYDSTVVQLGHPDCDKAEYYSNYLHVITPTEITPRQGITQGQLIAYSGTSENEKGFPHLHFEIRERGRYQKHTVNPFKYLPYTDTVSHTITISGTYIHTAGLRNSPTVTARAVVTSPRNELDFNRITMAVHNGFGANQRIIDFQVLNKEMTTVENPEILDNPYINDVCIMPARFNSTTQEYRIDFVFYGLQGSNSITLTTEAADVHSNVVSTSTTVSQTAGGATISPAYVESWISPGMAGTFTHILINNTGVAHTFTVTETSAQGEERWDVQVTPLSVPLDNGESATITATVAVSETVPIGIVDCIVVTATSEDGTQAIAVHVITASRIYLPIVIKNYPP